MIRGRPRPSAVATARVAAIASLLAGALGLFPGVTTDAPGAFAGEASGAELFGLFRTSVLHDLVHVLFGVAGLVLARTPDGARSFLLVGGGAYAALWALGLVGALEWLPANEADHWLHFVLGVVMAASGFLLERDVAQTAGA